MRLFLSLLLIVSINIPTASAFRDLSSDSKVLPAVNHLVEIGAIEDKGFFRADDTVPAVMFWKALIADTGFEPESATFDTPLPSNISEDDDFAPYLREGIRRGFINGDENFSKFKAIKRIDAIKYLVQTKAILPPKFVSTKFKSQASGFAPNAQYLFNAEAAYASGILTDNDINPLRPYENITRRELAQWIFNWHENGMKKESGLQKPNAERFKDRQYPYQKRRSTSRRSGTDNIPTIKVGTKNNFKKLKSQDYDVLDEVLNQVDLKFKFTDKLDEERRGNMLNNAIKALIEGLDDKYSSYVEPEKAKEFNQGLNGKFEGIGAYVEMINDRFTITSPIAGSPAEKVGLKANDIVSKVNDEPVTGLPIKEIIDKIKGPSGTDVKLWIIRQGEGKEFIVTRGKITIPPLKLEWKQGIPIVGMHQFSRDTGNKLQAMLKDEILPKKPRGIVFDLRNNPGGFLTAAVDVGSIFLDSGEEVFSVDYKNNLEVFNSKSKGILADYDNPMVFLQNKGTASASEILTSMIQDYKIGEVVGMPSLGKGTVQEVVQFTNGGTLKLTVAKWLTPLDRWINDIGVTPDVQVSDPTDQERDSKTDRQLTTAINKILGR